MFWVLSMKQGKQGHCEICGRWSAPIWFAFRGWVEHQAAQWLCAACLKETLAYLPESLTLAGIRSDWEGEP